MYFWKREGTKPVVRKPEVLKVFTAKSVNEMLRVGGTQSWVLDARRARKCEYAVLCRNDHSHEDWADGSGPHANAFMVGHVSDVVPSAEYPGRWLVKFDRYALVDVAGVWEGWRNPIRYEADAPFNLEELHYEPMPEPDPTPAVRPAFTSKGLTIDDAKQGLAITFGVKPEAVEITIRG